MSLPYKILFTRFSRNLERFQNTRRCIYLSHYINKVNLETIYFSSRKFGVEKFANQKKKKRKKH